MIYRFIFIILFFCSFSVSAQAKTLLVLGDSLSASYGIPVEQGWVSLLSQRLREQGYSYNIVNASISGETTLGAKIRVHALLKAYHPDLVIIELGANDGLRGFSLKEVENNFITIIGLIKQAASDVLLVPMLLPPNYGTVYNLRFASIYDRVSNMMNVEKSQFILQNIAEHPELMQADGLHPVATAQPMMLDNIWQDLQKLLKKN